MAWFSKGPAPKIRLTEGTAKVPEGLWLKCEGCSEIVYRQEFEDNLQVCPQCNHHYPLGVHRRMQIICDEGSFEEYDREIVPADPLSFRDSKKYKDRLKQARKNSTVGEAVLTGNGRIEGRLTSLGFFDFEFMGGSMGSVAGEKVTRVFERGAEQRSPVIICSASGGARMQEGILSLMQMAKTTTALAGLRETGQPYISVMSHPTTGGVAASFAMLGDINIAEPGALIGFAGPRVIEQTIRQRLPEGFQRAEFLLEHGMVDMIVPRHLLKERLSSLLGMLCG